MPVKNMCFPPQNEVPLKASGTFLECSFTSAMPRSVCMDTGTLTSVLCVAEVGNQAGPPQSAAPGGSLPSPAASLDSSCSPAVPQLPPAVEEAVGTGPPLLSWPDPPSWPGWDLLLLLLPLGHFFSGDEKSACSPPSPANLAVCSPPRTSLSWFHALGSRKSQASS